MECELANDPDKWFAPFARAILAGRACDEIILGAPLSREIEGSLTGDDSRLFEVANSLKSFQTLDEYKDWKERMLKETRHILDRPTVLLAVTALALLLLKHGRVTGLEATELLESNSKTSS